MDIGDLRFNRVHAKITQKLSVRLRRVKEVCRSELQGMIVPSASQYWITTFVTLTVSWFSAPVHVSSSYCDGDGYFVCNILNTGNFLTAVCGVFQGLRSACRSFDLTVVFQSGTRTYWWCA